MLGSPSPFRTRYRKLGCLPHQNVVSDDAPRGLPRSSDRARVVHDETSRRRTGRENGALIPVHCACDRPAACMPGGEVKELGTSCGSAPNAYWSRALGEEPGDESLASAAEGSCDFPKSGQTFGTPPRHPDRTSHRGPRPDDQVLPAKTSLTLPHRRRPALAKTDKGARPSDSPPRLLRLSLTLQAQRPRMRHAETLSLMHRRRRDEASTSIGCWGPERPIDMESSG